MKATNWIVSAMLVSGCGILSAESERVFFGTGGADGIYTALLDSDTGAISDLKVAVKTEGAGFLVKDKAGKFLYATGRGEGKEGGVAAFAIGEEGVLTPVKDRK
ncbi:MAG: beta-propeller fold lactonase family protein, partial [Verrucomicrobiales bacterium]